MSGLEARIAEVLADHVPEAVYTSAEEGYMACCGCDWRGASYAGVYAHQAEMMAPLIREQEAEAFKRGFDDAHNQHTAHRERRNLPHPGIAYNNPYRSNDE